MLESLKKLQKAEGHLTCSERNFDAENKNGEKLFVNLSPIDQATLVSPANITKKPKKSPSSAFCHCFTIIKMYSFSHAAPSVWNSLPHDIKHIQSVTAFKTALKTHLFKYYLC